MGLRCWAERLRGIWAVGGRRPSRCRLCRGPGVTSARRLVFDRKCVVSAVRRVICPEDVFGEDARQAYLMLSDPAGGRKRALFLGGCRKAVGSRVRSVPARGRADLSPAVRGVGGTAPVQAGSWPTHQNKSPCLCFAVMLGWLLYSQETG